MPAVSDEAPEPTVAATRTAPGLLIKRLIVAVARALAIMAAVDRPFILSVEYLGRVGTYDIDEAWRSGCCAEYGVDAKEESTLAAKHTVTHIKYIYS